MRSSKLSILFLFSFGLFLSNVIFQTTTVKAEEEFELEDLMENQMEDIQEGVRQEIKVSIKQESYEVAAENILEPTVATAGFHPCQSAAGTWTVTTTETYCDSNPDNGTHTVIVDANCTFTVLAGPNLTPLKGIITGDTITMTHNFFDAGCGGAIELTGSGTATGNTISGSYAYSNNPTSYKGTFTGTKQ